MRVEEVGKVGINNIGKGSNFVTNITIDQCGYCGFKFNSISNTQISGNISRCGQYYFNFSYDEYLKLDGKVEEAYSLLYGNSIESSNITITNDNGDYWDDAGKDKYEKENDKRYAPHKVYLIEALETNNLLLRFNIDATDMVVKSKKGRLVYNNKMQTVIFYDGELGSINGVGISEKSDEDKIKIREGEMYINSNDKESKIYSLQVNDIMSTTIKDEMKLTKDYGGTWEKIGEKIELGTTVHYYKMIEN
ncbi:hypothetical protein HGQ85_19060, partial [Clostridioides difficile]|nr:hypothetical protein [Clostridioides difficile]